MSIVLLVGVLGVICIFGSMVLAGLGIWTLAIKKDSLPKWGIALWLLIVLAGIILIVGGLSLLGIFGNLV
ncbi:hypothetical protein [Anaerotignum sp. MB30-C6]|uniref:hypothetical protein n=1 Tax=Anaerotignum sp. MB30-C6 TaxID=3070814 RepID=UPI0027DDC5A0|nr:hypothetical protein [Anaerotignum sp. MB30-C6]WMI80336.1 hypothetical protein RBQ60_10860 [Anaerotignum sp. MB30-C6]